MALVDSSVFPAGFGLAQRDDDGGDDDGDTNVSVLHVDINK